MRTRSPNCEFILLEWDRPNILCVSLERLSNLLLHLRIPDPNCHVVRPQNYVLIVWEECNRGLLDIFCGSSERPWLCDMLPRLRIPDPNRLVARPRDYPLAIWRECDRPDPICVSSERLSNLLPCLCIPDPNRLVLRPRDYPLAIWGECDRPDLICVSRQYKWFNCKSNSLVQS